MVTPRPYQQQLIDDIRAAWDGGARNVLAVQATRTGKTVVFSDIISRESEPCVAIAHRQELVGQMSLALARCGVMHRIIAPDKIVQDIIKLQVRKTGRAYYHPVAAVAVAGVDTLLARADKLAAWCDTIRLWVIDEGHHIIAGNKWGRAVGLFPHARGLAVTATPTRADGQGLGRHADGLMDTMVVGLQMREAINAGYLLDYRIYAPKMSIDVSDLRRTASGDYNQRQVARAAHKSTIVGDVVDHYQRIVPGKQAVVFATDLDTAGDMVTDFKARSIPVEMVSAKTPTRDRARIMAAFEARSVRVLVNVDLFGEGTDLPDLDAVIMARPTASLSLYAQQFNRASTVSVDGPLPDTVEGRLAAIAASAKPHAIIIDMVGNVQRFKGPPDARHNQDWTLDARDRNARTAADDAIPVRSCLNEACMQVYERFHPACPYCGHEPPPPAVRSGPEFVDGDLALLDAGVLAAMRGDVDAVDVSPQEYRAELQRKHCPPAGLGANVKRHIARQEAQALLRAAMEWWVGARVAEGLTDRECHRLFYLRFGVDVLTARALGRSEALALVDSLFLDTLSA